MPSATLTGTRGMHGLHIDGGLWLLQTAAFGPDGATHQVPSLCRRLSSLSIASTMVRIALNVDSRDFSEVSK